LQPDIVYQDDRRMCEKVERTRLFDIVSYLMVMIVDDLMKGTD